MSRWLRAAFVAAVAAGAAAVVLNVLPGWKETAAPRGHRSPGRTPRKSRDDVVDELSEEEKQMMMRELGYYV